MTQYLAAVSALATMTGRLSVEADTPEAAAAIVQKMIAEGTYPDPDFEFVDGGRPAPGSAAVDSIRDETDTDDLFTPPAPDNAGALEIALAALKKIAGLAPETEPEEEDYHDTESAYGNGLDVAGWESGEIARLAIARVDLADSPLADSPLALAMRSRDHLIAARDLAKAAGCSRRFLDKIRLAISSAKGAVRHAHNRPARTE